ncbi:MULTISPECIES: hypothetical protein [unclassified Roseitalea]|uniref:hypothetical protein n=1 Tax=unclassified Roseitalea TaxID=2639107 RepID=UPI00273DA190|nr:MULTISPECIES: hypothetical protein [unclassified Roseitalea]
MEQMVFAIFMMGCGHNLDVCRPIDNPEPVFESRASCERELERTARQVTGFPTAIGSCIEVEERRADADLEFDWFFAADGRLIVEPRSTDLQLARN